MAGGGCYVWKEKEDTFKEQGLSGKEIESIDKDMALAGKIHLPYRYEWKKVRVSSGKGKIWGPDVSYRLYLRLEGNLLFHSVNVY